MSVQSDISADVTSNGHPVDRDWLLFQDFCAAGEREALPASVTTIAEFFHAVPVGASAAARRRRAIRRAHENAGKRVLAPFSHSYPPRLSTPGLGSFPTMRYPEGLRGRRDAFVVLLVGELGFTRHEAQKVTVHDVALYPQLSVAGRPVRREDDPVVCPACALTRWLRVVNATSRGWRSELRDILDPRTVTGGHDCRVGLDGEWRFAEDILPSVDRYGWAGQPLSDRSISEVMARARGGRVRLAEPVWVRPPLTGRYAEASSEQLAAAYDDVNEKADALLERIAAVLGEGTGLAERMAELGQ